MTETFCLKKVNEDRAEDVKANIRMQMFFVLRDALKERREQCDFTLKELGEAMGKDQGYVSRVTSGKSAGITAETLAVFLDALDYRLHISADKREHVCKSNYPQSETLVAWTPHLTTRRPPKYNARITEQKSLRNRHPAVFQATK